MKQPNFSDAMINDEIDALCASVGNEETTVENLILRLTERGKTQEPKVGPGWKPRLCRLLREWRNAKAQPSADTAAGSDVGDGVTSDAVPGLALELSRANASVTTFVTAHIAGLCKRSDHDHRVLLDKITADAVDQESKLRGLLQAASADAKSLEEEVQRLTKAAEADATRITRTEADISNGKTAFAALQKDLNARTIRYEADVRELRSTRDKALQSANDGAMETAKLRVDHGALVNQHTECMTRTVTLQAKVDALAGVSATLAATLERVTEVEKKHSESQEKVKAQRSIIEELRVKLAVTTGNAEMMRHFEVLLSSVTRVGQ